MKKFLWVLLLAPSLAFAADAGHTIIQKGRRFNPAEITIRRGETLTFTNNDEFIHQIYSTDLFDSDERHPGQTLDEAFSKLGTFQVRCHIHPKMKLVVHVNKPPTSLSKILTRPFRVPVPSRSAAISIPLGA